LGAARVWAEIPVYLPKQTGLTYKRSAPSVSAVFGFAYKLPSAQPGTSIKRGGLGGSVKCPKFSLQTLFQVGCVMEFGEHSTKQPHTKFQTQILMYDKAAALGSLQHTLL
jgi:hypothetical protein